MSPLVLLFTMLSLAAPTGTMNVPDPSSSTIPTRFVFCPEGDLSSEVIIRDFARNPINQADVLVDFSVCSAFVHCGDIFPAGVTNLTFDAARSRVMGQTDLDGRLVLQLAMSGSCLTGNDPIVLTVHADAVPVSLQSVYPYLMSPDQNGDLVVDAADEAILNDKIANPSQANVLTADLNGDGILDDLDLAVVHAHTNHVCSDRTPVRRSAWGELKLLYR